MKRYELMPTNGRASFYGKAAVEVFDNGVEVLWSYNTPIMFKGKDGTMIRYYNGWTQATGTHIKSFCGLDKKQFMNISFEEYYTEENFKRLSNI